LKREKCKLIRKIEISFSRQVKKMRSEQVGKTSGEDTGNVGQKTGQHAIRNIIQYHKFREAKGTGRLRGRS
jgi:hypothetical protein